MKPRSLCAVAVAGATTLWASAAGAQDLVLDGEVPLDDLDHFFIPFEVPPGTVEIEVQHDDQSEVNVLDWGLEDAEGFRGWGGGNAEPAIVGLEAASRSYIPGEVVGAWKVVVGKVQIEEMPATYHVEIFFRDTPTLAPQTERAPYAPPPALSGEARWYAGDFHVHSEQSGDARPPIDEVATFARSRGLDFVELSEHNTNAQLGFYDAIQPDHPDLLLIPGVEWTTYDGHANGIGAVDWVDHKIGQPGVTVEAAVEAFHDQGALFSLNHPALDVGSLCFGCLWEHDLAPSHIDAVEIITVGWMQGGSLFAKKAIALWDEICDTGQHAAAIGGSDDHRAGVELGAFQSPIGDPTTMVYAEELSVKGILDGVRDGRTVVKLQGPDDPMIELQTSVVRQGDTVSAEAVTITAVVSDGVSDFDEPNQLRFVRDGEPGEPIDITSDPFEHNLSVTPPTEGQTRVRAEVLVADQPRTVTSHVWVELGPVGGVNPPGPDEGSAGAESGCGACALGHERSGSGWLWLVGLVLWGRRRLRRR